LGVAAEDGAQAAPWGLDWDPAGGGVPDGAAGRGMWCMNVGGGDWAGNVGCRWNVGGCIGVGGGDCAGNVGGGD
jgi:hypothetical protein